MTSPLTFDLIAPTVPSTVETLERLGLVRVRDYLTAAELTRLKPVTWPGNRASFSSEESDAFQIFWRDEFKQTARHYLHVAHSFNETVDFIRTGTGHTHADLTLHFGVIRKLRFLIYLTDSDEKNGCFHCEPGSHLKTQRLQSEKRAQGIAPTPAECRRLAAKGQGLVLPVDGKAGTLIIFDTDLFHRAGKVWEGERLIVRSQSVIPSKLSWRHHLIRLKGLAYSALLRPRAEL